MEGKKYDEAQAQIDSVRKVLGPWTAKTGEKSGGYRQLKGLMAAVGQPVGDPRPPTLAIDDKELAEAKQLVRQLGWA